MRNAKQRIRKKFMWSILICFAFIVLNMKHMNGITPYAIDSILQSTIDLAGTLGPRHLNYQHTLLEDTHVKVVEHIDACKSLRTVRSIGQPRQPSKKRKIDNRSWQMRHFDFCEKSGRDDWHVNPIPSPELQDLFPALKRLVPREFDVLCLRFGIQYPEKPGRVLNLSQSVDN